MWQTLRGKENCYAVVLDLTWCLMYSLGNLKSLGKVFFHQLLSSVIHKLFRENISYLLKSLHNEQFYLHHLIYKQKISIIGEERCSLIYCGKFEQSIMFQMLHHRNRVMFLPNSNHHHRHYQLLQRQFNWQTIFAKCNLRNNTFYNILNTQQGVLDLL